MPGYVSTHHQPQPLLSAVFRQTLGGQLMPPDGSFVEGL